MYRIFIARVVALAIAITAFGNAPAKANEEIAGALATIVGLAIVGKIVSDQLGDDDIDRATRNIYDRTYFNNNQFSQPRINNNLRVQPRPLPRRANRAFLPADCLPSRWRSPDISKKMSRTKLCVHTQLA